jgi:hypothetical protein
MRRVFPLPETPTKATIFMGRDFYSTAFAGLSKRFAF